MNPCHHRLVRIINLIQSSPGIKSKELAERCDGKNDLSRFGNVKCCSCPDRKRWGPGLLGIFLYLLDWTDEEAVAFGMLSNVLDPRTFSASSVNAVGTVTFKILT